MDRIIENEALKITVSDHGAELSSAIDKENGNTERIWNADPSVWNRHAPILFPFVGKVTDNTYRIEKDGEIKEYSMKTQHGFARDCEFTLQEITDTSVTHILTDSEETRVIYPYAFRLSVTTALDAENSRKLNITWKIDNLSDSDMYYSIGGHPGFICPIGPSEKRSDYYLDFSGKKEIHYRLLAGNSGLVDMSKEYTLTTDHGFVSIKDDMFDLDALVFDEELKVLRIAKPDKTPFVTLHFPGFSNAGIWSKPNGSFVCLEPWMGRTDNFGFTGTLKDKPFECFLSSKDSAEYQYAIEFHK